MGGLGGFLNVSFVNKLRIEKGTLDSILGKTYTRM